jgi:hypothetical protein
MANQLKETSYQRRSRNRREVQLTNWEIKNYGCLGAIFSWMPFWLKMCLFAGILLMVVLASHGKKQAPVNQEETNKPAPKVQSTPFQEVSPSEIEQVAPIPELDSAPSSAIPQSNDLTPTIESMNKPETKPEGVTTDQPNDK